MYSFARRVGGIEVAVLRGARALVNAVLDQQDLDIHEENLIVIDHKTPGNVVSTNECLLLCW